MDRRLVTWSLCQNNAWFRPHINHNTNSYLNKIQYHLLCILNWLHDLFLKSFWILASVSFDLLDVHIFVWVDINTLMDNVPAYTGNSFMSHSTVSTFLQGWDGSGRLDLVDFQFKIQSVYRYIFLTTIEK